MSRDAVAQDASFPMAVDRPVVPSTKAPVAAPAQKPTSAWNTKDLALRLGVDVASAASAGALTCPLITIIDRAIIEKASKGFPIRQTITSCLKSMITKPGAFFTSTPFLLIYALYSSTYLTANTIDTVTSTLRNQSYDTVTPGPAKFISTTVVNMAICVYKDARFAKIFGAQPNSASSPSTCHPKPTATGPQIPKVSYTLFCLRDSITIFASFNVPPLIAPSIPDFIASTPSMKSAVAQFSCPALMQFASTPMHLLGLDLFNRQPVGGLPWTDRMARIRRDYVPSCFARMGKIVPAYGIGGVVNVRMRAMLMEKIQGK
ncbi:uncharacterized protein N7477_001639 [Penicillium maclennaniae]|uniref:uncharacterized protein n=1 Tax=Penicillium maclennaniae TaxID=1343394 RepID=UPI0025413D5A|nr:uncharacterized protein N7477_001639 [Penicillium maclennaniae]KAJ5681699.1 hypothetical protein N7477_001639 [Penicillium maclennaniae]